MNKHVSLTMVLLSLWLAWPLQAQKKPGEAVTVKSVSIKGEIKPGSEVTAVVQFLVEDGYHVQANVPSESTFIPAVLKLEPVNGLVVSPPRYPAGKEEKVEGLPKPLKVYGGTFEVLVPFRITTNARLPLSIPGTLSYQACKGSTCFAPRKLKLAIPVEPKG